MLARKTLAAFAAALLVGSALSHIGDAVAQQQKVTVSHYFSGELGRAGLNEIFAKFQQQHGIAVEDSPIGHEDFKTGILVRAAGGNLPDIFSYWAGARTQFVVDAGRLQPIDDLWNSAGLDEVVVAAITAGATRYNDSRYLVPFGYHYAGMFYNPKTLTAAGVDLDALPQNWDEFLALCATLKEKGVTPIALGSKNRWPAQFWFDYLLLRSAGPDYRARLMAGEAAYTDDQVKHAMSLWRVLTDAGYFTANANADDWTDAADKVARGDAAMTLMGTWITGYWNGIELKPGEDYDFFPFPRISADVADAAVGPVDGWLLAKDSPNRSAAEALLTFLISDTESQAKWARAQGALSPNVGVDEAIYSDVMKRALATVAGAEVFAFNYDLATPPPVAEVGLNLFAQFMDDPSAYEEYLEQAQAAAKAAFEE